MENDAIQMDAEIKSPYNETGVSKTEELSETNGLKDRPATPKVSKASLKTRSQSSEREKEQPKTPKDSNKTALPKTRSRSATPQKFKSETKILTLSLKKLDEKTIDSGKLQNDTEVNGKAEERQNESPGEKIPSKDTSSMSTDKTDKTPEDKDKREENTVDSEADSKQSSTKKSHDVVEMEPLVLIGTEEPDPELQFDETSDLESGKESPVISRCKTRRSHTRNIPTPKTPKSDSIATTPEVNDHESEKSEKDDVLSESVSVTFDMTESISVTLDMTDTNDTDNLSTQAEVGSDLTRLNYCEQESLNTFDDSSYLNASRERSLSETLRNLSSRRAIRPLSNDYRKRALKNQIKSDLNYSYPTTESIQHVSGMKRKDRSETPEEVTKKFKPESPGLVSLFVSPISNLRSRFSRSDVASSTPKLTGYKDCNKDIRSSENDYELSNGIVEEKKSWCSIM